MNKLFQVIFGAERPLAIWKYITLRYLITFLLFFTFVHTTWKFEVWSNSRGFIGRFEDWFMFFWLFGLPVLFEFLYQGLALSYCLKKLSKRNWLFILLLFVLLFFAEYMVTLQFFARHFVVTKLLVSTLLFLFIYGKQIIRKSKADATPI